MKLADTLDRRDVPGWTIAALERLRDEVLRLQKASVEDAMEELKSKAIALMEQDFRQKTGREPDDHDREEWALTLVLSLGEEQEWMAELGDDPEFTVYNTDQHKKLEDVLAQMKKELT
jgi:hypothetical protein